MAIGEISRIGDAGETIQPQNVTAELARFLYALDRAFLPADEQSAAMRRDFLQGIQRLSAQGMDFAKILRRLDPKRLYGFYEKPTQNFYPLDNGAKQYPLIMRKGQMAMFRIEAVLREPVEPVLLQLALTFTLKRFPHYATRLRRGEFWYYLKPLLTRYAVLPDSGAALQPIDVSDENAPLFRVLYKGNVVAAEMFHILADGMGGMVFIKTLLTEYYRLQGEDALAGDWQVLDTGMPAQPEDTENGFTRFRSRGGSARLIGPPAIRVPAEPMENGAFQVEQLTMPADRLVQAARRAGLSVTALLSAVILSACKRTAQADRGVYRLQVPVDLRRIFGGHSLRNFSWYGAVTLDAQAEPDVKTITGQLQALTDKDRLSQEIGAAQRVIRWLRFVSLQWKTLFLRTAYRVTGDYFFTSTLSNLGSIHLSQPLQSHVLQISAALGPSPGNPFNFALCTAQNIAVLSCTRTTGDTALLEHLIEAAQEYGLTITRKG